MAEFIDKIETKDGPLPINYCALTNKPIQFVTSLDETNPLNLRDLETGPYVLYGYFRPFPGSPEIIPIDHQLVNVDRLEVGSHLLAFAALNTVITFIEILVDDTNERGFTYTAQNISLLDLHGLIARVEALEGA